MITTPPWNQTCILVNPAFDNQSPGSPFIVIHLLGRTDNKINNHWHTTLKKHFQQNAVINEGKASKPKDNESNPGSDSVPNNVVLPATTSSNEKLGIE